MSAIKSYFTASFEAIKNLFRKPYTVLFTKESVPVTKNFRGKPVLTPENCTVCKKCERVCPTGAIVIEHIDDTEYHFSISLGRCCYCQECENACNFDAIALTDQWMTSSLKKEELTVTKVVQKRKRGRS